MRPDSGPVPGNILETLFQDRLRANVKGRRGHWKWPAEGGKDPEQSEPSGELRIHQKAPGAFVGLISEGGKTWRLNGGASWAPKSQPLRAAT